MTATRSGMPENGVSRLDYILATIDSEKRQPRSRDHLRVIQSWERCINEYALHPDRPPASPLILEEPALKARCEKAGSLLDIARPEMENLYQQIAGSGTAIMVVDKEGYVLNYLGDPEFSDVMARNGLCAGGNWSEAVQGTNAMGTCLADREPVLIHHTEHFFARNGRLTCSAAPIFGADGELIGALDASSASSLAQQHTTVLVNMAVQMIENRLFIDHHRQSVLLRFHSRPEFINTPGEGLIAFNDDGLVVGMNRGARQQFGFNGRLPAKQSMRSLFDVSEADLMHFAGKQSIYPAELRCSRSGRRFYAMARTPGRPKVVSIFSNRGNPIDKPQTASLRGEQRALIDTLEFGDPQARRCIDKARRVIDVGDLPVLIGGETGTGKGLLAKALHQSSDRAARPFVSINCAAIPEALLESELFGYNAGAFTGGNRNGATGKIRAADGGTLFLDEIGDMPLHLQTALLQVLEDREVVPLGSTQPVPVDVRVISASHQDLRELSAKGDFRTDLLYRLQGLQVTLPALRDRDDKLRLASRFLNEFTPAGVETVRFADDVVRLFERYTWPGNIRQMRNVIRTACLLAEDGVIGIEDLSDEMRAEAASTCTDLSQNELAEGTSEALGSSAALSPLEATEIDAITAALKTHKWSVSKVSRHLNLSRTTLYRKMRKYGISQETLQ